MGERGHLLRSFGSSSCLTAALPQRGRSCCGLYEPTKREALWLHVTVFKRPLGEKDLSAQPCVRLASVCTVGHHHFLHYQWLPCPLFPFQDTQLPRITLPLASAKTNISYFFFNYWKCLMACQIFDAPVSPAPP